MGESDDKPQQSKVGENLNDDIEEINSVDTNEANDIVIEEEDEQPKDTIKRLRDKLKECTAQKREYLDGWQRSKADLINTKKEFTKERERISARTAESIISDILPVLDSFEMAFADKEAWNNVDEQWRSGVEQIYSQLKNILKSYGVEAIAPEIGDDFDPKLHTSVATEATKEEAKDDTVAECEKTGYRIEDRIIRSANVVVFKVEEA